MSEARQSRASRSLSTRVQFMTTLEHSPSSRNRRAQTQDRLSVTKNSFNHPRRRKLVKSLKEEIQICADDRASRRSFHAPTYQQPKNLYGFDNKDLFRLRLIQYETVFNRYNRKYFYN